VHSPALHHPQRLAVHLHPHLVTVHLLEVLRVVGIEVPRLEGVVLVVEGEAVLKMTPIFRVHLIRGRDHQDLGVEEEGGRTLIRDRLRGHRQEGEEDHHREVHQGGGGEARVIARTAVIARVGAEAGVDLRVEEAMVGDDEDRNG
jgi:hypothetical protein